MKIGLISDTHGEHDFQIPEVDLLIHSGDITMSGKEHQVQEFIEWFNHLPIKHKVFIAGNHDFLLEKYPDWLHGKLAPNTHYLNDSGVEIEGINIWGSPVQPWFHDWAFNRERGEEINKHWNLIPKNTDILITHGPPYGILDETKRFKENVGCQNLLDKVKEIEPKVHCFGHIHEAAGCKTIGKTIFINASVLNERYYLQNEPIVIEIS